LKSEIMRPDIIEISKLLVDQKVVGIIDYGLGNVQSVSNALTKLNVAHTIITSSKQMSMVEVDRFILPGVGSFKQGMKNLIELGFRDAIIEQVLIKKKPILGICLGMQLLAFEGNEGGQTFGLGLLPGKVNKMPVYMLPHVGWNDITINWGECNLLKGLPDKVDLYFIHSYHLELISQAPVMAECKYDGFRFVAAVEHGNIFGTQFHPEKSQSVGLAILKNFTELKC